MANKLQPLVIKWKAGDLFTRHDWLNRGQLRVFRVHRVKGKQIWYLPNSYGCNPPRGCLHYAYRDTTTNWQKLDYYGRAKTSLTNENESQ